jgi:hypothetical protein
MMIGVSQRKQLSNKNRWMENKTIPNPLYLVTIFKTVMSYKIIYDTIISMHSIIDYFFILYRILSNSIYKSEM